MATVIILHGPPAAGKYTIAKELASLLSLKLFHNHLVVDALLALFAFGSENFVKHRGSIWLEAMADAVSEGTSFIFTFSPEATTPSTFVDELQSRITAAGGKTFFVRVDCVDEGLKERMGSTERREHLKLWSYEHFEELRGQGAFVYPVLPFDLSIDSYTHSPVESARIIAEGFAEHCA